jgi:hypothetical protein
MFCRFWQALFSIGEKVVTKVVSISCTPFAIDDHAPLAGSGSGPHDPDMEDTWRASVDSRLARVEGGIEGLKGSLDGLRFGFTILVGAVALVAAMMMGGFAFLGFQNAQVSSKIDAIPQRLSEEFRAMRAEMSAQTSAIANSITATRQAQPPAPPQIIVIPTPQPQPQPTPEPPKP